MSEFDWSDLDAAAALSSGRRGGLDHARRAAAGVTQSAVSHLLDKLRAILGDPLFVNSGRGIVADRARRGAGAARARLLRELEGFARRRIRPARGARLRHRRQRPAARPVAARRWSPPARAGARRRAACHPLRRADAGDAAQRPLPADRQPAPARGRGHPAEATVRGPLSRLLRRRQRAAPRTCAEYLAADMSPSSTSRAARSTSTPSSRRAACRRFAVPCRASRASGLSARQRPCSRPRRACCASACCGPRQRAAAGPLPHAADVHDLEPPRPRRSRAPLAAR